MQRRHKIITVIDEYKVKVYSSSYLRKFGNKKLKNPPKHSPAILIPTDVVLY